MPDNMAHRNIPIFIPHLGCPHQCVFCNQRSISGHASFSESRVREEIEEALSSIPAGAETEIAFFGGSFTGIDRDLMIRLLETATEYTKDKRVSSIRLSTRPDYISGEILEILSHYPVKEIELGLQSMDDAVLRACERGHSAEVAKDACRAILKAGFSLVGQMMVGLPGASLESERQTAEFICDVGASAVRIYPTVVFYETELCRMAERGEYKPLTDDEAIARTLPLIRLFEGRNVPVIRIGLCASESLTSPEKVYGGANHPALGELCWSNYYYELILDAVRKNHLQGQEILLIVPKGLESKAVGQHRSNIERLLRETGTRIQKTLGNENVGCIQVYPAKHTQEESKPCT